MKIVPRVFIALTLVLLCWPLVQARSLSLEERVEAQRAIEQVYWRHRIWPADNPRPKPPLDVVLPQEAMCAKVENYLQESNALDKLWGRPVTTAQLQNEMDRMVAHTKDAQVLKELFDALGNDPFVIAETLARQTVADRLVRDVYATEAQNGVDKTSFDSLWPHARETVGVNIEETPGPFTIAAPAVTGCVNDTWSPTKFGAPDPRYYETVVWTGSEMIVWGGGNDSSSFSSGGRYNPSTDTWTATSEGANVPTARIWHTAVWTGSEMIVWGGWGPSGPINSGGRYNPTTDTWMTTSIGPNPRTNHTAVWTGSEMIVWGGYGINIDLNSGARYSPTSDTWLPTSTGTNVPLARHRHVAVWTGSEMIVWGGYNNQFGPPLNTGARYDPRTDTWVATSLDGVPEARDYPSAVWTGQRMIVWGGVSYSTGYVNTGGRYDPQTNTWQATSTGTNVPSHRQFHSAVWTGTEMIVWGGEEDDGGGGKYSSTNTGGRYDPISDTWSATPLGTAVPKSRASHAAVWTGSEMIVWSGLNEDPNTGATLLSTGGRYSPNANTWAPMGATSAPEGRSYHTAVWTGSEMIVWGGSDSSQPLGTGGRYVPATDAWTPTSTGANSPVARAAHAAVWTGTEMIVWGGSDGSYLNTGARYAPLTDTWLPTSVGPGVPAGRNRHTAVWTGTEMMVWGGLGQGTNAFLNSGGRYDPLTNTWVATSTANAPPPRQSHTAAWTGTEMIVWGGNNTSYVNTGGRYRPGTNTWAPTTSLNAPFERSGHTAVWTGSEMIVWGGYSTSHPYTSTGGRYNPDTDTWVATSLASAPIGRENHTSVWTGAEMIVWGGYNSGFGGENTGGRYDPRTNTWVPTSLVHAPVGRGYPTSVWTAAEMVVWGGADASASVFGSGGRYCACVPATFYRDADADGFGDSTNTASACAAPPGYVDNAGDCDDTTSSTYPGAPEVKDGKDNQCPGDCPPGQPDCGLGVIDEITGPASWNGSMLCWPAQVGADGYQVVRSPEASFTVGCSVVPVAGETCIDDPSIPVDGAYFYLVRSLTPNPPGSWGQRSDGTERLGGCLP